MSHAHADRHNRFALVAALFLLVVLATLGAFAVRLNMSQQSRPLETLANTPIVNVFSVRATASRGAYGSPDFVSRQRTVRITP